MTLLAGRYRVDEVIGHGASGSVARAWDTLAEEPVAIKRLLTDQPELARREITALRLLTIRGVARILDEGEDEQGIWIALEWVEGTHFPGQPSAVSWTTLRPLLVALLRVLRRMHRRGLVHADLKPANVLVHRDRVVVVDFGISAGAALPGVLAGRGGSRGWTPVEAWRRAERYPRDDLYAVGRLALAALGGTLDNVPPAAAQMLAAMTGPEPGRPESADAPYRAFGGRDRRAALRGALSPDDLRAILAGPEPFLHLPSTGAALLWNRSEGDPARLRAAFAEWERHGVGEWVNARFVLDRWRLELAEVGGVPAPDTPTADDTEILAAFDAERATGALGRATAVARAHLGRLRAGGGSDTRLLTRWACAAHALETAGALNEVLLEIERSPERTALAPLQRLCRAAEDALSGRPAAARERLPGQIDDDELEAWRIATQLRTVLLLDGPKKLDEALEALVQSGWATTPARASRVLGWQATACYNRGEFTASADMHVRSRTGRDAVGTLSALRNEASSRLDAGQLAQALRLADEVAARAAAAGLPEYEANAVRIARVARYRLGHPLRARPELVDAASHLDPRLFGLFGLCEAAVAWRTGDRPLAARLALAGRSGFRRRQMMGPALLCEALALACEGGTNTRAAAVAQAAETVALPSLRLNILGLLRFAAPAIAEALVPQIRDLVARHGIEPHRRWDVLTAAEALTGEPTPETQPVGAPTDPDLGAWLAATTRVMTGGLAGAAGSPQVDSGGWTVVGEDGSADGAGYSEPSGTSGVGTEDWVVFDPSFLGGSNFQMVAWNQYDTDSSDAAAGRKNPRVPIDPAGNPPLQQFYDGLTATNGFPEPRRFKASTRWSPPFSRRSATSKRSLNSIRRRRRSAGST